MERRPSRTTGSPVTREEMLSLLAERRRQAARPSPEPARRPGPLRVEDLLAATDPLGARPDCPHPRVIEDYVAGRLNPRRVTSIREHLTACPACRRYAVGLRDTAARPAPPTPPAPAVAPTFGVQHVFGLAVAGMLFLLANTAFIDVLGKAGQAPVSVASERPSQPARSVVAPAPVALPGPTVTTPAPRREAAPSRPEAAPSHPADADASPAKPPSAAPKTTKPQPEEETPGASPIRGDREEAGQVLAKRPSGGNSGRPSAEPEP